MPGRIVSIGKSGVTGWAVHSRLPDYRVLVHVISGTQILSSIVAEQPPPATGSKAGEPLKGWFHLDLGPLALRKPQLRTLCFCIGETGEYLEFAPGLRAAEAAPRTVEDLLACRTSRPWITGATYLDAIPALNEAEIVELFYHDFLDRPSDPDGLAGYLRQLQGGQISLEDIRRTLLASGEYRERRKDSARAPGAVFSQPLVSLGLAEPRSVAAETGWDGEAADTRAHTAVQPAGPELLPEAVESAADSLLFESGWHPAEYKDGAAFRWMSKSAVIANPHAGTPCSAVVLHLAAVYGSRKPMVECYLDEERADVRVRREGRGYVLEITPADQGTRTFAKLRLESSAGGSPSEDGEGSDQRILSLNVLRMINRYGAATHPAAAAQQSHGSRHPRGGSLVSRLKLGQALARVLR